MLNIDLELPHSYEVDEIPELPGTGQFDLPLLYFPRPKARPEHNGLWLRIRPLKGKPWIGVFAFLYESYPAMTRVISTFDPDYVCIIAKGAGYIVNTAEPDMWQQIPIKPVLDVRLIREGQLLLVADHTRLAAFDKTGLAWCSPRLCWDDLRISTITDEVIEGTGYDPTDPSVERPFAVNIRTGESLISPPVAIDGRSVW
jgi:hypothetical protein